MKIDLAATRRLQASLPGIWAGMGSVTLEESKDFLVTIDAIAIGDLNHVKELDPLDETPVQRKLAREYIFHAARYNQIEILEHFFKRWSQLERCYRESDVGTLLSIAITQEYPKLISCLNGNILFPKIFGPKNLYALAKESFNTKSHHGAVMEILTILNDDNYTEKSDKCRRTNRRL